MNSEVVLDLEQLAWPALLIDVHGSIHQANAAAKKLFEPALNEPNVSLTALWSSENQGTATDFLAGWRQSQAAFVTLKFQVASGTATPFTTPSVLPADRSNSDSYSNIVRRASRGGRIRAWRTRRVAAKAGLHAEAGPDGVAGFQQRPDRCAGPHFAAAGQG